LENAFMKGLDIFSSFIVPKYSSVRIKYFT